MRILNTRPSGQNLEISAAINKSGNIAIDLPTLEINATSNAWLKNMPDLGEIDYAIFTSPNAVKYYFSEISTTNWNNQIQVIAIGNATLSTLKSHNINALFTPKEASSESLLELCCLQDVKNKNIILITGTTGRDLIYNTLTQRGATLTVLKVYKTCLPKYNYQDLKELWQKQNVDLILYTSQQSMYNLFTLFDEQAHPWLRSILSIVISQRLSQTATQLGIQNIKICSYNNIIETIKGLTNDQHGAKTNSTHKT